MNRSLKTEDIGKRTNRSSGFDVESLLVPNISTTTNTSPKLTAKVQPFEIKENDAMEWTIPRQDNSFQKAPSNQPLLPNVGFAVPPPLALANLQLYSLWSQAGMVNWPFIANHSFTHPIRAATTQVQPKKPDVNTTRTKRNDENPLAEGRFKIEIFTCYYKLRIHS